MTIAHIVGRIVTKSDVNAPVVHATVSSKDKRHAIMQTCGSFMTMVAKAKTYALTVRAPGYADQLVLVPVSASDLTKRKVKKVRVKLALAPATGTTKRSGRPSKR
jgi:hypothetical protein